MKKLPVVVWRIHALRNGYAGPCSQDECSNPADWAIEFTVADVEVKTWVCDAHSANLGIEAEDLALARRGGA